MIRFPRIVAGTLNRGHRTLPAETPLRKVAGCALLVAGWATLLVLSGSLLAQAPPAPWSQCPAVGAAPSCGILIVINSDNSVSVYTDTNVGPYDGYDDTLVGILNNSPQPVPALSITSTQPSFAFSGDGICDTALVPAPHPAGCPFGVTGYEGPGVSYTVPGGVSQSACGFGYNGPWKCANDPRASSGTVNFSPAVPPGGHAYFGLQQALTAQDIQPAPPSPPSTPTETLRSITTTDTLPGNCPGTPASVTNFLPSASDAFVYFVLDHVQAADAVSDTWLGPDNQPYVSHSWGTASGTVCYSDRIDIAGNPPSGMPGTWTVQIYLNQKLLTTVQFTILSTTLPRVGVLAHIGAGGGWATSVTLVNTSPAAVTVTVVFHADDGSLLVLPLTVTSPAGSQSTTAATVSATIAPNASLLVGTANQNAATLQMGWADVLGSGPVDGFAIFGDLGGNGLASEGTAWLQTTFTSKLILPFDNTSGFVTSVAIVNLADSAAPISVIIRDADGSQIGSESISLAADGHGGYILPQVFTEMAGKRGTIEFENPSGGGLAGLGLRFSPFGTFTSVPTILVQ